MKRSQSFSDCIDFRGKSRSISVVICWPRARMIHWLAEVIPIGFVEEDRDVVEMESKRLNGLSDAHSDVNRVKSHQTKPRL